jgi:hypothetical protein
MPKLNQRRVMRRIKLTATIGVLALAVAGLWSGVAVAASLVAVVAFAGMQGPGEEYGTISLSDHQGRARTRAVLHGLPGGRYAVTIHEGTSCEVSYESHSGPEGVSPLIPVPAGAAGVEAENVAEIVITPAGTTRETVNVPQISGVARFKGHAIIVRGERLLCGVLK